MPLDKAQVLKAKAQSFKAALDRIPVSSKKEHISSALAKNFNELLDEIAQVFPDLKDHLPKHCVSTTKLRFLSKADDTYLDLEIFVEQVIRLLDMVN